MLVQKRARSCCARPDKKGLPVTAEVCPHHFTLDDTRLESGDSNYKMNPPLRDKDDVQAMKEALKDGTITCIATDHAPHAAYEKGPMERPLTALLGWKRRFLSRLRSCRNWHFNAMQLIACMSTNPAHVLHCGKGTLQEGTAADVTLIDPKERYTVDVNRSTVKVKTAHIRGWS